MSGIQCVGDQNVAGGRILSGDNTVFINGKPVAPVGSPVSCHKGTGKDPHKNAVTTNVGVTSPQVFINGKPITLSGSIDSCGHPRYSTNFTVGAGV